VLRLARTAMRTRWEIVLADDADPAYLRAAGEEALDEIEAVEARISAFRPSSDLAHLNARAALGPVIVEPRTFRFLEQAQALSRATDGAFDPTVGPLLACWNLAGGGNAPDAAKLPSPEEIDAARALVGMERNVWLDEETQTVRFARPGVRLDPGGIGKGYALERALDLLEEAGVRNVLLHGGTSTIGARGAPAPDAPGWTVAVAHPRLPGRHLARVCLRDAALSVSAAHGKAIEIDGQRFGHVLDPRTGWPVRGALAAAVVAASPTDTDALSTGLLVLGPTGIALLTAAGDAPRTAGLLVAYEEPADGGGGDEEGPLRVATHGDCWQEVVSAAP
jgi:thiamine biosynthesis lipoprotein